MPQIKSRLNSILQALAVPWTGKDRDWILGLGGAMLLIHLVRELLPGLLATLVAIVALFLLSGIAFNAGVETLRRTAAGPGGRGAVRFESEFSEGLAGRLILLWLLATLVVVASRQAGGVVGMLVGLALAALAMPGITLVLVLSNALLEALYPPRAVRLAARIGWNDYALLIGLIVVGAMLYLIFAMLLGVMPLPTALRNGLLFAVWVWFVLAWFGAAGTMLWTHRSELNLIDPDTEAEVEPERFTRDPEALWNEIMHNGGSQAMHTELIRQLERADDRARLLEHGRIHIPALLLAFEDEESALERAARLLELDRHFALAEPDTMFALLQCATRRGHRALTGRIAASYLNAFRSSLKRNEVRLLACEALADSNTAERRDAERWYHELMTAELSDEQRERLKTLAPAYL